MQTIPLKTTDDIRKIIFSKKTYIVISVSPSWPFSASVRIGDRICKDIEDESYAGLCAKTRQVAGLTLPPYEELSWTSSCGIAFAYAKARLSEGDRVWDDGAKGWGVIKTIDYGPEDPHAELVMDRWCFEENSRIFDEENIAESPRSWRQDDIDELYLHAAGIVDLDGYAVCHEHLPTEDDYPYFSPARDENIFETETKKA